MKNRIHQSSMAAWVASLTSYEGLLFAVRDAAVSTEPWWRVRDELRRPSTGFTFVRLLPLLRVEEQLDADTQHPFWTSREIRRGMMP